MNILHLDSSILGANSVSRGLSAAVVAKIRQGSPDAQLIYRDLASEPVAHLSGAYLAAQSGAGVPHAAPLEHDLADGSKALADFLAADVVVIGVALYNFTVSSQLKSWIDRIVIAGKTFRYGEKGPEGLAGNKRLVLAIARGGLYGPGMPAQPYEHAETYLRAVFGFMGIFNPEVIVAEGIAIGPEQRDSAVKAALKQIEALPANA